MPDQHDQVIKREIFIKIRKLAAIDLVFHGTRFILAEFAGAVILCGSLGIFNLFACLRAASHPLLTLLMGLLFTWIALNYVPLLLYALDIVRHKSARQEVAFELEHKDIYARKYTLQSLMLILPLVVPILALVQEVQKRSSSQSNSGYADGATEN